MARAKMLLFVLSFLCVPALAQTAGEATPAPSLSQPALSPDGSQIVFASGGDLWTVPSSGGTARLLVAHPATDSRPLFSPDGKRLAFVSTRTGNGDVYVLTLASGELRRLTWDDELDHLDGWSRDGAWIYFSSSARDIANMNDLYRVRPEGGTPMEVSADRYVGEYFAAPSPDGRALAFVARGVGFNQWWRHGHSHLDESEIWLLRDGAYRQVSARDARDLWPMWSPEGRRLFWVSDRDGAENLWYADLPDGDGMPEARPVTAFRDGRLLWPALSQDGRTLVFERGFGVWKLDLATGKAAEVAISLEGAPAGAAVERARFTSDIEQLALSPDGKKVAFVVHGEVFAASAKDGGSAARVTETPAAESQIAWAPDSRRLVYVSDRDGRPHLFLYDFGTGKETQLTSGAASDDTPRFSPDGKQLAFHRDRRELRALDVASGRERLLASGFFEAPPLGSERPFVWSPDSRWVAYLSYGERQFRNLLIVPAEGGEARQVSFLANVGSDAVSWSPDGKYLLFATGQRTEDWQLARIDLMPRTPKFREDQFRSLFDPEPPSQEPGPADPKDVEKKAREEKKAEEAGSAVKKPEPETTEIVFEGIRRRLTLLPVGFDVGSPVISPDGKWAVLLGATGAQSNLYVYSLDELARGPVVPKQLTSTAGDKLSPHFTPDSKEVFYLDGGEIRAVPLESGQPRSLSVTAEMDVDFAREKLAVFDQAWRYLRDNFVDPGMHGVDWEAARAELMPRVAAARTSDELYRLLNLMIGELNASHTGVRIPPGNVARTTGYLGLRFDREEYEENGRLRIREVLPLGPAAVTRKVKEGDYLLAVDGKPVDGTTNLDQILDHEIGRQVTLTVAASPEGRDRREVAVRPADQRTAKGLAYRKWVEDNRAYVARVSNGRFGYVHMFDMGAASLAQLLVDLDAENQAREGVVIDIRNNNGGFVNAYAIDILSRRGYLNMTYRGMPTAPARTILGQRALERPTVLVTNQHSLSDAEDFTEGYRTLGLGKVVGEPTAGWIIYTANVPLLDGAEVRLPFIKITDSRGQDMEMSPRPVDVEVVRPIGEGLTGKDSQLDAAVKVLTASQGNPRTPR